MTTAEQYDQAMLSCRNIFEKKTYDYGNSWRVLRTISIVDQIFIKAKRIRTIQVNKTQRIADDVMGEFRGIVNYAIIGLIQLEVNEEKVNALSAADTLKLYDEHAGKARALMLNKNHDYGEAWRDMSQESFVDLILTKLLRIKQILANDGKTLISEGIDANYFDIINYAIFALITG